MFVQDVVESKFHTTVHIDPIWWTLSEMPVLSAVSSNIALIGLAPTDIGILRITMVHELRQIMITSIVKLQMVKPLVTDTFISLMDTYILMTTREAVCKWA